ncbi:MAG TPA: hypothetical protein VMV27_02370 [Candidatus Binataceae bacterium]|nr:hypothetical protein [Candidatus Binataceae bacterium]
MAAGSDTPDLDDAIAAFNRGDYFAAAELFEGALARAGEELRGVAGALNQISAALHLRFERGGRQAAVNLLSQAMLALDDLKPARGGLDLERLYAEVSALNDDIRAAPRGEHDGLKYRARIFLERRRAPKINRLDAGRAKL